MERNSTDRQREDSQTPFNPLNAELNPICHLLALLGAHHILHVSRIRVKHHGRHVAGIPCSRTQQGEKNESSKIRDLELIHTTIIH
jgi:hypothetical protein